VVDTFDRGELGKTAFTSQKTCNKHVWVQSGISYTEVLSLVVIISHV